jgi:protein-disulfide isomerase
MSSKRSTATRRADAEAASVRAAAVRAEAHRRERRRRTLLLVAALAVVALAVAGLVALLDRNRAPASAPRGVVASYAVPAGPATAPVTVSVYEDFLCPFCGDFEKASRDALQRAADAGDVRVRYHVLNFLDDRSTSDYSTRAANALAVVLDTSGPGAAKKFHDLLFENQPEEGTAGISDGRLLDYAVEAGAERGAVASGIRDRTFEGWVDQGNERASDAGIRSTPTVQVDGKTLTYRTIDELVAAVEKAIAAGS